MCKIALKESHLKKLPKDELSPTQYRGIAGSGDEIDRDVATEECTSGAQALETNARTSISAQEPHRRRGGHEPRN